ncbi:MAG: GAF domain-containing protein, partial [Anaerolineales bacterium]|nr:GAF domain-containing protein [Anaerolineales bacterium]
TSIETIGVMVVQHYEKSDIYSEQDVEFLTSIAGQIALMVEKKRNEETLLQFRDLMDETEDAIFLIDLATSQYLDFNNTALTYLGYSREEMSQLGLIQVVQPSITLEEWRTQVKQVIEKNGMLWETEYCRKDGTLFPVEVSARIWGYGGRNVMIVIARDITERKLVEDALRASESNLLTAQAIAHLGNWVLDPVSGQGFWSPEMYHIFEYSFQAEPPRFDEFLHLVHPEDVPHLLMVNQEAAQTDATLSVEFRTNPARGPVKHILGLIHHRMQPDGTIILLGTVQDITERKQAMEALRESEDRFRSLIENLPIGVYRTTPGAQGRFLMANPAFVSMFDYEAEEYLQNITVADLYVNPEDRKNFSDHLIAQGSVTGVELHLKKRDGTPVWSSVTARVVHTEDGQVSHFDCTIEDITERKKAAEELKRRGDEFASLYEITRDLTIQWDLPRLLNMVVSQAAALLKTPGGGIYLYDPERGDLSVEVSLGAGFPTGVWLALGEGLAGRVAQSLQPLVIDDYQVWAGRAHYYNHIPIRAVLGVPMVYGGELIGVLLVEHFGEVTRPFTQTDVRLLSLMAAQAAGAVHNARLFEATRYRLAEMEAVSRVSTALRTTQALGEMLTLLLDETLGVLDTEAGSIVLYDAEKGGLYPAVARGWFAEIDQTPMSPEEGVAGHVFSTGKVYSVREFVSDPHPRASSRLHIPPGWGGVCLPIRTAQEIVGVLFVSVPLPRELIADEVRLLVTLCEIAGNALHRTRLHEQTQRSLRRLGALHAVDLAISSSFDLNVSLNVLLEQTLFHLEADAAVISRLNTSLYLLEFAAGRGLYTAMASKTRLQLGDAYAGQVALERRLISLPDLATAPPLKNSAFATVESIRAYHAVPLIAKGQVKGVLEVFHRKPFRPDQEWLNFLQTLGGQAAIAIDSAELFTGLQRSNMELRLAYEATIEGWSRALDLRDEETEGHTQRVTETTLRLARAMGLSGEELNHIRRGALLHDIGKMGVPDNILLKPGDLTPQEWAVMRRHPEYAYEMLAPIEYLHPALAIPYCHHEKWDGTGYPRGLKGDQIPLAARLFTIVDIWDALRSNRPYRKAWPEAHVRTYIREQSGKFFDPQVVETFLSMLAQDDQLETP